MRRGAPTLRPLSAILAKISAILHLVLRLRQDNKGRHKLSPPWEVPYIIAEVLKPGTYKLANENGEVFTNA